MTIFYRKYRDYNEYLIHQSSKLDEAQKKDDRWSRKLWPEKFNMRVKRFLPRLSIVSPYMKKGKTICLGARTGAEVVAFKKLGFKDTIGIDINPGKDNKYVIKGDFHKIEFEDNSFDNIYCNCIDHIFDLKLFSNEVYRVLRNKGILILEIARVSHFYERDTLKTLTESKNKIYESFACDDFEDIKKGFKKFKLKKYFLKNTKWSIAVFKNKKN